MNATKALELITPIPAEEFITNMFTNGHQCCTLGHLNRLISNDPSDYSADNCSDKEEVDVLFSDTKKFMGEKHNLGYISIPDVNDYDHINGYTEKVIKDRAVHLFKDMIAAGY